MKQSKIDAIRRVNQHRYFYGMSVRALMEWAYRQDDSEIILNQIANAKLAAENHKFELGRELIDDVKSAYENDFERMF